MTPASQKVQDYRRTPKGLLTLIYSNQKMTSKKMGRLPPAYTKEQLGHWLLNNSDFNRLYANWVNSGFDKLLSPSIDRIRNNEGYSFGNIRLVTWAENLANQKNNLKAAIDKTWNMKPVDQLDLDGNFIASFPSVQMAMRHIGKSPKAGTNVAAICNGKWQTAYGYRWRWSN